MTIKQLWRKICFIGITEDQEFSRRDVVLLNKLAFIAAFSMIPILPFEILMNGWQLVPFEFLIIFLCSITLILSHFKRYLFAKIYFFFIAVVFIMIMAIAVGPGSGNHLFLIPAFIAPAMLLKDIRLILSLSIIAFLAFIAILLLQKEITPLIELDIELKEKFSIIFYTVVFVIIFFQIYYFKDINLRFQDLVLKKNELIEEKNKEIVDSINYAQRIQSSYLPNREILSQFFEKSFLFFKPKDIVSGDFYWFYNEKTEGSFSDEKLIVAADCTGHGVPGAIMSVICANALNDVVDTRGERNTGKILDQVRDNVVSILKTKGDEGQKDGMDVALLKVNKKTGVCQFSGAHNPLWILRSGAKEFEVIKGDKQPVGSYSHPKPFTTHEVQLVKGDRVYIFSDGLQDQFGGEKGKKFKAANMKALFTSLEDTNVTEQKTIIEQAFDKWKGDLEQVDDVVLIAFEF